MRDLDLLERGAGVRRAPGGDVQHPHGLRVLRVRVDVVVVPGALAEVPVLAALLPGLAAVVRAAHRTVLRIAERVHALGPRAAHRAADLPELHLRAAVA